MTKKVDYNEFWLIEENPLTKVGVFPYLGSQISDKLEPDKIYQVLRPAEEIQSQETINSFKLLPIVDDHTMLGTGDGMMPAEEKGIHGVIGENVKAKEDMVVGDLKIYSETLKDLIENGKKDLSMGYFCDYDLTPGTYKGQHYDAIQRNIRGNHVALVDEGRMGKDVCVMDKRLTFDSIKEINEMKKKNRLSSKPIKRVMDEDLESPAPIEQAGDEDIDKRAIEEQIGGILKDKVDNEIWNTVMKLIHTGFYNDSLAGNNDEDDTEQGQDEDEPALADENKTEDEDNKPCSDEGEEEQKPDAQDEDDKPCGDEDEPEAPKAVSEDAMIKAIAQRNRLIKRLAPVIGSSSKFEYMSARQLAKHACDCLDLKPAKGQELTAVNAYLRAYDKYKVNKTYSLDSGFTSKKLEKDKAFEEYIKG